MSRRRAQCRSIRYRFTDLQSNGARTPKPPVTGVTGVTRVTNPITMDILAVTRAAETCDRCDDPSHACRGGGLSVGRSATVSRARQKCRPPPHDGQAPSDARAVGCRATSYDRVSAPASLRTTFLLPPCFHSESSWKQLSRPLGEINQVQRLTGAPEEIRTPDPQIRSLM